MKKAEELYMNPFMQYDYTPIINNFGEIILREDEDGYHGDTHVVIKSDNKFGYLVFGWGSCSGCDRLQACETYEDIQELMDSLYNDIKWFESFNSLKEYINNDSIQELKYYYYTRVFNSFRNKLNNVYIEI